MRKLVVIAGSVLVLGGIIFFLTKGRGSGATQASRPEEASLLVLGRTNLSAGTFVVFSLSNGTRTHIVCVPEAVEQASSGTRARTPLAGRARSAVRDWIGLQEELTPGQAFTFMVPPPTTNVAWRLVFMCQERARLIDPVTDTARHLFDTNAAQVQDRQFSGRRYYVSSPEVAP